MSNTISSLTIEDDLQIKKIYGRNAALAWGVLAIVFLPLLYMYFTHYTFSGEDKIGCLIAVFISLFFLYVSTKDYRRVRHAEQKRIVSGTVSSKTYDHGNAEIWINLETGEARQATVYLMPGWTKNELNTMNVGQAVTVEEAITVNNRGETRHDIIRITPN